MSGELSATVSITDNATGVKNPGVTSLSINRTNARRIAGVITLSTSAIAIPLGDMTTTANCIGVFKNLHETATLEILRATGATKIMKLRPGECWPIRFGSEVTAPYAVADVAAAAALDYVIYED